MATRAEIAMECKKSGMNCAQSVACAFADYTDLDKETLKAMTQTLGVGVGLTMEGTCGAVVGAAVMLGLIKKDGDRMANMKTAGALLKKFMEKNGSVTCKELKGRTGGPVLRSCEGCVEDAANLLEEILKEG